MGRAKEWLKQMLKRGWGYSVAGIGNRYFKDSVEYSGSHLDWSIRSPVGERISYKVREKLADSAHIAIDPLGQGKLGVDHSIRRGRAKLGEYVRESRLQHFWLATCRYSSAQTASRQIHQVLDKSRCSIGGGLDQPGESHALLVQGRAL